MNRNEAFAPQDVGTLAAHLAWASLEITSDDVEDVLIHVAGDDHDVSELKITLQEGKLTIEQPTYGLSIHQFHSERWMQLLVRIPRAWKGAVDANTITAPLKLRGLSGSDITLDSVSGSIHAASVTSITTALRSVSGDVRLAGGCGEKLNLRTVSGSIHCEGAAYDAYRINTVSGDATLALERAFAQLEGVSVSGRISVYAPMDRADAVLRAVSGRLRTSGVSIQPDAPRASVSSVSGDFEINCSLAATIEEE